MRQIFTTVMLAKIKVEAGTLKLQEPSDSDGQVKYYMYLVTQKFYPLRYILKRFSNMSNRILLVFHSHRTDDHYLDGFKQHTFGSQFMWVRSLGFSWALCLGSDKGAVQMLSGAVVSSEAWGSSSGSCGWWQNSFPHSYRTHGSLVPQGQQEKCSSGRIKFLFQGLSLLSQAHPGKSTF